MRAGEDPELRLRISLIYVVVGLFLLGLGAVLTFVFSPLDAVKGYPAVVLAVLTAGAGLTSCVAGIVRLLRRD